MEDSKKEIQDLKEKNNQHNIDITQYKQQLTNKLKLIQKLQVQATHNQLQLKILSQENNNINECKLHSLSLLEFKTEVIQLRENKGIITSNQS